MTYEEAIELLKRNKPTSDPRKCGQELCLACDIAMESIEKQIPKKVGKMKETDYGSPYYCPECEAEIIPVEFFSLDGSEPKEKVSYCWKCGQVIDWSSNDGR